MAAKLLAAGHAYESFSTNEEVDARRLAAGQDTKLGYDNHDRFLTDEQKAAFRAEGREPVLRLKMPDEDLVWTDLVRGEIRFAAGSVPDFVLVRGNGVPLYPFVNPVDDALMGITDVLRGEDLLPSTPAAARAVRRADRHRGRPGHPALRAPALRHRRGQQEAVQARPAVQPRHLPRARLPARGASPTTWRCWAGRSPRTATSSRWRRWSRPSTSPG